MRPAIKTTKDLIGAAGVHYVASELSRRGFIALPTIRNTAAYDVIAATSDGRRHANIQVKSCHRKRSFFPMCPSSKVRTGIDDYYVFVHRLSSEGCFDAFLLSGKETKRAVAAEERRQAKSHPKTRIWPSVPLNGANRELADVWRSNWLRWKLGHVRSSRRS